MIRPFAFTFIVALALAPLGRADDKAPPKAADKPATPAIPDRATLEKKFAESMTNVALIGFFTDSNKKSNDLSEEKYIIEKVVKEKGDDWLMTVRIQYAKYNVPVTLRIPVIWAGDTPILSVTNLEVPLLGTFNARVVIHENKYAGSWSGANHGGHLFGRIEKQAEKKDDKKEGRGR